MSELNKRKDITRKVDTDKKEVDKETKRAEGVVSDAKHVDTAGKNIKLKGTAEGISEITNSVSKGLDKTKDVHNKLDKEQEKRFGEIQKVEKNLADRSNITKSDIAAINKELAGMKSKDTGDARSEMKSAAKAGEQDVSFMKDAEKKETSTRETGKKEMTGQKNKMKGFSVRKR